jgi:CheY-like chemotaxis protein
MAGGNLMNLAGMKVLIVDDMQENLDTLVMIMESEGYKVATATNGNTALETASDFQPDLVLLDVKMDGIDGFETSRQLSKMALVQTFL